MNMTDKNNQQKVISEIMDLLARFESGDFSKILSDPAGQGISRSVIEKLNAVVQALQAQASAQSGQTIAPASADELQLLFETMTDGFVVINSKEQFTKCNPAALSIMGLTEDEFMGRTATDPRWKSLHEDGTNFPFEDQPGIVALRTGKRASGVINLELPSGEHRWINVTATQFYGKGNSADSQSSELKVLVVFIDITARKEAEKQFLASKHELVSSEIRFRTMFTEAPLGVALIDSLSGHFYEVNQKYAQIAGRSKEELEIIDWMSITHPDDVQEDLDNMARLNAGIIPGFNMQKRYLHKDGKYIWIDMTISPFDAKDKLHPRHLCMISDITERKKTEKLLEESRESAIKANHTKDEFLSLLSHELRTPLTSILGWIQLLRMGKINTEKTKQAIEAVEKSAKVQGQLINDLLDVSRIQAGKINLTIQEIDPSVIIYAVIDSTRSLAASKSIQIETLIDPLVKKISADPIRLQQILWNLITNSIKFSPQNGRIWIKIDRIMSPAGEQICIHVRDNGTGIKPEFIPKMFQRFSQADSSSTRAYGGLGLGLAIVKQLTEMHDGTVKVESEGEGKGSTFTVFFPLKMVAKQNIAEAEAEAEATLDGLRILLVEDDASSREVLAILLQSFGAEVMTAESAKEGLAIFEDFKPDILVSDIAMPVEDGYSLIKKIRSYKSELAKTPALALTAYAGSEDVQRMLLAGFQAHLAKPADSKKLALAISRLALQK